MIFINVNEVSLHWFAGCYVTFVTIDHVYFRFLNTSNNIKKKYGKLDCVVNLVNCIYQLLFKNTDADTGCNFFFQLFYNMILYLQGDYSVVKQNMIVT